MSTTRPNGVALAVTLVIAVCAGPAPAVAQAPSPNATYDDGLWQVPVEGGEPLATHGLDEPVASDTGESLTSATDEAEGYRKGNLESVVCASAGENRYRALYARPHDVASEFARRAPQLRRVMMDASAMIDANAQPFGVHARLPVVCAGGQVAVTEAELKTDNADMNLETVLRDLHRQGFAKTSERYVVFIDGCLRTARSGDGCANGGLGTMALDDRATPDNHNNGGRRYALEFGPSSKDPGGAPSENPDFWYGLLHEIGHTMGAVQPSAPHAHSESLGHCDQGRDFMCRDVPELALEPAPAIPCPTARLFDCRNDDYFNPTPPPGSYLAGHWNLGSPNNHWLRFSPVDPTTS